MIEITEKRLRKLGFEKELGMSSDVLDYHYEFWIKNKFLLATINFIESDYGLYAYFIESPSIDLSDIIDMEKIDMKESFDYHITDYKMLKKIIKKLKTEI